MKRPAVEGDRIDPREHVCLTVSFDHEIVDGASAARFVSSPARRLSSGGLLDGELVEQRGGEDGYSNGKEPR